MRSSRAFKIARWVVVGVLLLPIVAWLGISLWVNQTLAKEADFVDVARMIGPILWSSTLCAIVECDAELVEGLEIADFDVELLEATPVALDVDEWGRVYVAEAHRHGAGVEDNRRQEHWLLDDLASRTVEDRRAYYQHALDEGRIEDPDHFTREHDGIVVFEDTDADGIADRRSQLTRWNDMVTGIAAGVEVREGTIWSTAIPSVYRLRDEDRDGVLESEEVLWTGFGVKTSLSGHDMHGLVWGPDGKLYFSIGDRGYHVERPEGGVLEPTMGPGRGAVFRMNPDGSGLEVFATGVRNPQELAFDDYGNLFTGDNNGDGGDAARIVYLVEGGETGWAMPYQSLAGDYVRGPWVAERLWDLQHDTQPAWVLPPIGHIGNGPAGFVHYPGLGLPERYAGHFFLCDYGYTQARTGIWSFAVEPMGAGFEVVDRHPFAWSVMATDFDFGWDGQMFATIYDQVGDDRKLARLSHPESRSDPRLAELPGLVQQPMADKTSDDLLSLLAFADQRLRLRAQFELADRGEIEGLAALFLNRGQPLVPRLHALWGLAQIGSEGLRAIAPSTLEFAARDEAEVRAQLSKAAGQAGADWLVADLRAGLADPAARVRFFSAQSLGALRDRDSVDGLIELIRENADRDVFLRHAAVWALHRIAAGDGVWAVREDANRSVRLAVLLVLRLSGDPRIAAFLNDEDPLLVVEAARAIYDWPIESGMPALAELAVGIAAADPEDPQTSQALHRRVIGANLRLRDEEGARRLARYAADEAQLEGLRELALGALAEFSDPSPRDLTMGFYRPLERADPEILKTLFRIEGKALAKSSLGARFLEIAFEIGELPYEDSKLVEIVLDASEPADVRVSSLRGLRSRVVSARDPVMVRAAAEGALAARDPGVRIAARELLAEVDEEAGVAVLVSAATKGATESERRHAWRRLGESRGARVVEAIEAALDRWDGAELDEDVALDVIEAALARSDRPELQKRARRALDGSPERPVASRRWALAGGDPEAGRRVFQTTGECQRCHGGGGGHGAGVGPTLTGVSSRGARFVLESMITPGAEIARGYGTVSLTRKDGTRVSGLRMASTEDSVTLDVGRSTPVVVPRAEIEEEIGPVSGMPPIGLTLPPAALRDVLAYVMTLD